MAQHLQLIGGLHETHVELAAFSSASQLGPLRMQSQHVCCKLGSCIFGAQVAAVAMSNGAWPFVPASVMHALALSSAGTTWS